MKVSKIIFILFFFQKCIYSNIWEGINKVLQLVHLYGITLICAPFELRAYNYPNLFTVIHCFAAKIIKILYIIMLIAYTWLKKKKPSLSLIPFSSQIVWGGWEERGEDMNREGEMSRILSKRAHWFLRLWAQLKPFWRKFKIGAFL